MSVRVVGAQVGRFRPPHPPHAHAAPEWPRGCIRQSLVEFLAAQKSAVAKSVELRAVRATERPPKERTDDPAQVMFTRWTTVHHANIQSVQKLIMGCQADQKALLDAQVRPLNPTTDDMMCLCVEGEDWQWTESRA